MEQLDDELGSEGLCGNFNDPENKIIVVAESSNVTEKQLENAIEKHIAKPTKTEIIELNRQQGIQKLKELGLTEDEAKLLLS